MFGNFFAGKRVFLTGHTGFKGSWLSLWLTRLKAEVLGFSLDYPSEPNLFTLAGLADTVDGVRGDIRDRDAVIRAMRDFAPDLVIHMAAQSLVRPSYDNPLETFGTNVMGTANVLEGVRRSETVRAVVNVTSDKCYENRESLRGYRESDPMGGHDPYSASKGCAELVAASYGRSFFRDSDTAMASVRAGNVIGGGDFARDRLVPDMVRAFSAGEPVRIRSPKAIRPWQHVLDPLNGYLMLARKLFEDGHEFAGGWNFGPAEESTRTVGEVVAGFSDTWGDGARYELDTADQPHEAGLLKLDCSKARRLLGWKPGTDFETGLEWTASWYKGWAEGKDCARMALDQIAAFEALI